MAKIKRTYSSLRGLDRQMGYSLIELVVVVVILGILTTIAARSLSTSSNAGKTEQTVRRLARLREACIGDPDLVSGGVRTDYGYVGDIGALPASLSDLAQNPGLTTWDGPYLASDLQSATNSDLYQKDAWGAPIALSGTTLESSGGPIALSRELATSESDILYNRVAVTVVDLNGSPPGLDFRDSVELILTVPDGLGNTEARSLTPRADGFTEFDSVPMGLHLMDMVYLPAADTLRRRVNVDPGRGYYGEIQYFAEVWGEAAAGPLVTTIISAGFDSDNDGFIYGDDRFRGSSQPAYASGAWGPADGYSGGGLTVALGNVDNSNVLNMSGGWEISFTLTEELDVTISFRYRLTQDKLYDADEYSEMLAAVDGTLYGQGLSDYIERLYGDGPSGTDQTTGWKQFETSVGTLSAGVHTLTIGGFNNKKTHQNEVTEVSIDDVLVTGQ